MDRPNRGNGDSPKHGERAKVTRQQNETVYYFSFMSDLRPLNANSLQIRHPQGARCQVAFGGSEKDNVVTNPELFAATWQRSPLHDKFKNVAARDQDRDEHSKPRITIPSDADPVWNGLKGKTLGGGDFILVRSDGVVELDGRFTLRAEPDDTLIDVVYNGLIDLTEYVEEHPPGEGEWQGSGMDRNLACEARTSKVFEDFTMGRARLRYRDKKGPLLPVQCGIIFELATGPWSDSAGEDTSWMKDRYRALQENVWRYQVLTRHRFEGVGHINFEDGVPAPKHISIDVYGPRITRSNGKRAS